MTTPTASEAAQIRQGWDTYHRVMNSEWHGDGDKIRQALEGLLSAMETYSAVLNDDMHPASAYPELEHDDDAYAKALAMSAQDAADWANVLDLLVPERSNEEGERAA